MTIFFNSLKGTASIPYSRVIEISQHGNIITITYDGKEYGWLDEEKFVPKVNSEDVKFDTDELANMQMRSFYKACENNKGAFFFG